MSYELREVEINGEVIAATQFDVQDKTEALELATRAGGVVYTLYDDDTTYARGVFYVNRYAYVVFPKDVGEQFEAESFYDEGDELADDAE